MLIGLEFLKRTIRKKTIKRIFFLISKFLNSFRRNFLFQGELKKIKKLFCWLKNKLFSGTKQSRNKILLVCSIVSIARNENKKLQFFNNGEKLFALWKSYNFFQVKHQCFVFFFILHLVILL